MAEHDDPPDVTNLERFLDHLEPRDADAAAVARELLARGWRVTHFWGPVQMDVWGLTLTGEGWTAWFGIERGYSDGIRLRATSGEAARDWLDSLPAGPGEPG